MARRVDLKIMNPRFVRIGVFCGQHMLEIRCDDGSMTGNHADKSAPVTAIEQSPSRLHWQSKTCGDAVG
jgi:hypothetical protein